MLTTTIIFSIFLSYSCLTIYQQSHYCKKEYYIYFLKNIIYYNLIPLVLFIIIYFTKGIIFYFLIIILWLYSLSFIFFRIKLKFTPRIIRLIFIYLIYFFILSLVPYINILLFQCINLLSLPVLLIDSMISKKINKKYINIAKTKLDNYKNEVIGITGSFGKSSVKKIYYDVLSEYTNVVIPPKSFNTPLGIASFLEKTNLNLYSKLILEYGVSKKNDMDELLKLKKPNVAVITEIGPMHLKNFKTIDNILKEKMKIIKDANIIIANFENEYLRNYNYGNKIVLSYGFNYGRYKAINITDNSFDLYDNDKFIIKIELKLNGIHQILNTLAVLSYLLFFNYDINIAKNKLLLIEGEKNRLEVKKTKNGVILDDSYNSNPLGFKNALALLKNQKGKKVLLTPGIVELGHLKKDIHKKLIPYIVDSCDCIILIGILEQLYLYQELKNYNKEVYLVRNFNEGMKIYKKITKNICSALLIENDVTDIYLRRLIF